MRSFAIAADALAAVAQAAAASAGIEATFQRRDEDWRHQGELAKKELEWLRRGAPARSTKPKARLRTAHEVVDGGPAEVGVHLGTGSNKLKMLAVMSDQRLKGFETTPTLKERGIDVSLGAWRGMAVPKGTPPEVVDYLRGVAEKTAKDPAFIESLQKLNLGYSYADANTFGTQMVSDTAFYKKLIDKIGMKLQ